MFLGHSECVVGSEAQQCQICCKLVASLCLSLKSLTVNNWRIVVDGGVVVGGVIVVAVLVLVLCTIPDARIGNPSKSRESKGGIYHRTKELRQQYT